MPLTSSLAHRHVKLKEPIHPVVRVALDHLQGGGRGKTYSIAPAAVNEVRGLVQALTTPQELRACMKGLLELGFFLATCQHSPTAGHALAEIARDIARQLTPHPAALVAVAPDAAKPKRVGKGSGAGKRPARV